MKVHWEFAKNLAPIWGFKMMWIRENLKAVVNKITKQTSSVVFSTPDSRPFFPKQT